MAVKKKEDEAKIRVRYIVPERCPQYKVTLNLKKLIGLGPMGAKCIYYNAGIE